MPSVGRPRLDKPRIKRTFVLELDDPAQKHVDDELQAMIDAGDFQTFMRTLLVEALPLPGLPTENNQKTVGEVSDNIPIGATIIQPTNGDRPAVPKGLPMQRIPAVVGRRTPGDS